jgi:hypothetical protein
MLAVLSGLAEFERELIKVRELAKVGKEQNVPEFEWEANCPSFCRVQWVGREPTEDAC